MIINIKKYRWTWLLIVIFILSLMIGIRVTRQQEKVKPMKSSPDEVYGEFIRWKEVDALFPKYATAIVFDCDTKLKFKMQRRGGSLHADVQPLTAADTAIMKQIYQGSWSWKRRAVVVETADGRKIAGSMNGMPHGQGAIKGNNFDGHSCIHFRGSKTHGSRKVDLAHQMMIWKAAGVFGEQVNVMKQEDVIMVFFTAVNQDDFALAARMIIPTENAARALESFRNWQSVRVESVETIDRNKDNTYRVNLLIVNRGSTQQTRRQLLITAHGSGEGSLYNFRTDTSF